MKLGGFRDGVGFGAVGRAVGTWRPGEGFRRRGTIPNPGDGLERLRYGVWTSRAVRRLLRPVVGSWTTTNVWPVGEDALLATVDGWVFRSPDGGRTWRPVRRLPASSGPMGVLPTSLCEHEGAVYLAEYPLGDEPARVLVSDDEGRTWSTFHERTDVRHVHGLFADPYGGRLWATTGDTDAESTIGYFEDGAFRRVGGGSQRWRAVGLAFTPSAIVWGMDCAYADRVELLRLPRARIEQATPRGREPGAAASGGERPGEAAAPEPDVVGTTDGSVYYVATPTVAGERWVVAATAAEAGGDSTGPDERQGGAGSRRARVLAAPESSGYEDWRELCAFARRPALAERLERVPAANAYVFLGTHPDAGLVVNPYNTARHHGEVLVVPPAAFASEGAASDPDATRARP